MEESLYGEEVLGPQKGRVWAAIAEIKDFEDKVKSRLIIDDIEGTGVRSRWLANSLEELMFLDIDRVANKHQVSIVDMFRALKCVRYDHYSDRLFVTDRPNETTRKNLVFIVAGQKQAAKNREKSRKEAEKNRSRVNSNFEAMPFDRRQMYRDRQRFTASDMDDNWRTNMVTGYAVNTTNGNNGAQSSNSYNRSYGSDNHNRGYDNGYNNNNRNRFSNSGYQQNRIFNDALTGISRQNQVQPAVSNFRRSANPYEPYDPLSDGNSVVSSDRPPSVGSGKRVSLEPPVASIQDENVSSSSSSESLVSRAPSVVCEPTIEPPEVVKKSIESSLVVEKPVEPSQVIEKPVELSPVVEKTVEPLPVVEKPVEPSQEIEKPVEEPVVVKDEVPPQLAVVPPSAITVTVSQAVAAPSSSSVTVSVPVPAPAPVSVPAPVSANPVIDDSIIQVKYRFKKPRPAPVEPAATPAVAVAVETPVVVPPAPEPPRTEPPKPKDVPPLSTEFQSMTLTQDQRRLDNTKHLESVQQSPDSGCSSIAMSQLEEQHERSSVSSSVKTLQEPEFISQPFPGLPPRRMRFVKRIIDIQADK